MLRLRDIKKCRISGAARSVLPQIIIPGEAGNAFLQRKA
jgi:hypothetical protein